MTFEFFEFGCGFYIESPFVSLVYFSVCLCLFASCYIGFYTVSKVAVREATSGLHQTEHQILWHTTELQRLQKELLGLATERDKWKLEMKRRKAELQICKSATQTKVSAIKQQMLKLETLAKHVESSTPKLTVTTP